MKKLILLIPFLFLFFQKINGQDEPRLVKSAEYYLDISNDIFLQASDVFYDYDHDGNLINQVFKRYDDEGEIISWRGWKSDYNQEGLLAQSTFRRYNWDLDIWINEAFYHYEYDANGCKVKEAYQENLVNGNKSEEFFINNEDCQPVQSEYRYYRADTLFYKLQYFNEYLNGKKHKRTRLYYDIYDTTTVKFISHILYNEYEDIFLSTEYRLENSDTLISTIFSHELEYTFEPTTDLLMKKNVKSEFSSPGSVGLNIFNSTTEEYIYNYSCDGLLIQEDLYRESNFNVWGLDITSNRKKTLFSYEGENPCFNAYDRISFPVDIFPNPATSFVQLESLLFESGNTNLKIVDVSGRVVLEKDIIVRTFETSLDVGDLPNGTYIIQLTSGELFINKKLVVVR